MLRLTTILVVCSLLFALPARSQSKRASKAIQTGTAKITGTVRDPGGKPAPGASVSLSTATEIVAQGQADANGQYSLSVAVPGGETYHFLATLPGLAATSGDLQLQAGETQSLDLTLQLSAVDQHVVVSAALGELPATETASSVSVVTSDEMNNRDAQGISEVLRELPGTAVADAGRRGGVTGVFVRGGNSNYNLVMVDGIPLNLFGGDFDSSPLPTDGVAQMEVVRGAESALYGPDAVTSVVNLVTETGEGAPQFGALAEGGSFGTYRIATDGAGSIHGLSWSYDLARLASDGVVANDNYWNQTSFVSLRYARSPRRQFVAHFFGDANDTGVPGPYGSDPDGLFFGIDTISRDKQNVFGYQLGETEQWSSRVKEVSTASVTTDKYYFISPFGNSFENSYKIVGNSHVEIALAPSDVLVAGFEYNREDYENTFVTDTNNTPFVLKRTSLAPFAENRWSPSQRWTIIAGVRVDGIITGSLPEDAGVRPLLPASTIAQVNPRGAVSYLLRRGGSQSVWGATQLHASGGSGIRPPDGFELGFTDNPNLKPERSITSDVGIEQRWFGDKLVGNATYFYNRFQDQIVTLGGDFANLSTFSSDNLNNSRAQGVELSFRAQPLRSLEISGQYTWMATEILALDGTLLAESPYQVGQPLIRRPRNAGSYEINWHRGRFRVNSNGYARDWVLDLEPNEGTFACESHLPCLFRDHGYFLMNAGFGVRTFRELELFGQLNNVLNQKYEEVLGFPAYGFNFMAGIRLNFSTESLAPKHP